MDVGGSSHVYVEVLFHDLVGATGKKLKSLHRKADRPRKPEYELEAVCMKLE
jgi:hypothetical protein